MSVIRRLRDAPHRRYRHYLRQPHQVVEDLQRLLVENIIPFWTERAVDVAQYGYHLNHDVLGNDSGPAPATVVPQARMLWFFSRIGRSEFGTPRHAHLADDGFQFISEQMADPVHGGYFWQVDPMRIHPARTEKVLYGQAFVLYAFCEYYRLRSRPEVLKAAMDLFDVIERRTHDTRYGGYRDVHLQDWTEGPKPLEGPFKLQGGFKNIDTHIHVLEALVSLHRLKPDDLLRSRIKELYEILSQRGLLDEVGLLGDIFTMEWSRVHDEQKRAYSYAHSLEAVWLLLDACEATGLDKGRIVNFGEQVFDAALRFAFDHRHGGCAQSGLPHKKVHNAVRIWWVQAEALLAAAYMYDVTRREDYRKCFLKTLSWIVTRQADWRYGEWYAHARPYRKPWGAKAADWKAAYHNTRACLKCLELAKGR